MVINSFDIIITGSAYISEDPRSFNFSDVIWISGIASSPSMDIKDERTTIHAVQKNQSFILAIHIL